MLISELMEYVNDPGMRDLLSSKGASRSIGPEVGNFESNGISLFVGKNKNNGFRSYRFVYAIAGDIVSVLQLVANTEKGNEKSIITNAYTLPEFRRMGYAGQLIKTAKANFNNLKASEIASPEGEKLLSKMNEIFVAEPSDLFFEKYIDFDFMNGIFEKAFLKSAKQLRAMSYEQMLESLNSSYDETVKRIQTRETADDTYSFIYSELIKIEEKYYDKDKMLFKDDILKELYELREHVNFAFKLEFDMAKVPKDEHHKYKGIMNLVNNVIKHFEEL